MDQIDAIEAKALTTQLQPIKFENQCLIFEYD